MIRRRDVMTLLGGAAAAWPLAARAQQPKIIRLGYLEPQRPTEAVAANLRRQFLLGLRDLGYVEGRHFKMEDRSANGQLEHLDNLASELARLPVDMFVAGGDAPILAAMRASDTIPIVMTLAADPIRSGFIQSLARPGGNVTGMSALASDMAGKRLELLKEAVPRAQRVAVLWNSDNPSKVVEWKDTQEAASTVGLALRSVEARSRDELEVALAAIGKDLPDALLTFTDGLTIGLRQRIGSFALANRLPMISEIREFAEAGGVDGMTVDQLGDYLKQHWPVIREQLLNGTYEPKPVRRVEIRRKPPRIPNAEAGTSRRLHAGCRLGSLSASPGLTGHPWCARGSCFSPTSTRFH